MTGSVPPRAHTQPHGIHPGTGLASVDAVLQHPEDVAHRFGEAWEHKDADAIAALFVEDADFVNVVGFWWTRREQIRHNHAYGFEHIFGGSTMMLERVRVRDLGEVAVVHAAWRIEGQHVPGGGGPERAGERRGVFTFVVHRQPGGGWLAVAAQNTDVVPGAQTLLADGSGLRPARYDDSAPGGSEAPVPEAGDA